MDNPPSGTVAALINEELIRQGHSKKWLSDESGVPYTTLSRMLRGQSDIGTNTMWLLAETMGIHPSTITPEAFKSESVAP